MSKKGSDNFRSKLSLLFGGPRSTHAHRTSSEEIYLNEDILKELGKGSSLTNRLKILKDLSEKVEEKRLETDSIEALWLSIQDILKTGPIDARHNVIGFLCALVSSQYRQLGTMREELFQYITTCTNSDDLEPCFNLLKSLTDGGSDIHLIEEKIGEYMLDLLPRMVKSKKLIDILMFLGRMTRNNATYVDEGVISAVVRYCCNYTYQQPIEEVQECVNYIEIAVQYAIIPSSCIRSMLQYICCVRCITKKKSQLSDSLNKVMKMLVSSKSLGHTIICTMCSYLEKGPTDSYKSPQDIQRSSLYLLSTTLWHKNRQQSKQHFCNAVLPSILRAVQCKDDGVVCETLESLKFYLHNHSDVIEHISWDLILDILSEIVRQQKETGFKNGTVVDSLNNMLDESEKLYNTGDHILIGADKLYFEIIENCIQIRSVDCILNLMTHKKLLIMPGTVNWCQNLYQFMQDFYRPAMADKVRLRALEWLWNVVEQFYQLYELELLDEVVLRVLGSVYKDTNTKVRYRAVMFLAKLADRCNTSRFYNIINIILMVISKVVENKEEDESILICDELLQIFRRKISKTPSRHAVFLFDGLIRLATHFYSPYFKQHFPTTTTIRENILAHLWGISMSPAGETIFYSPGTKKCIPCPFLEISCSNLCYLPQKVSPTKLELDVPDDKTSEYAVLDLTYDHIDNLIYHCLERENDWYVLTATLHAIKKRLCNKQLLQRADTDLINLTDQLIKLVNSDNSDRIFDLSRVPPEFHPTDLKARVYPVLVRLIPYLGLIYLESGKSEHARKVIDALIGGLIPKLPKFAKTCIEGLTLALMEIPTLMIRPLQKIVRQISNIAAERSLALSTLTFLSGLAQCPELYKNFKEHDYKVLISVILPYTDPVKFEVFTIHFAHVVVCDWFVRCHYKHRPPFKDFILGQLRATVKSVDTRKSRAGSLISIQFDKSDIASRVDKRKASAESSKEKCRPRSGDFGRLSGGSTPRGSTRSTTSQDSAGKVPDPDTIVAHKMLIDVTEDLLERWMFSGRCNIIKKSPQLDLLFCDKRTKTWIVGNTLITISTSKSCEDLASDSCRRCKMVQAILGGSSLGSNSPQSSQEYGISHNIKIPIPGAREKTRSVSFNKIITPKCSCWCKDWAHVEIRSPTANSSMVLRMQNKCQFVNFDATTGGDCHLVTSIFDDDLTELLVKDIQTDYSEPFLENLFDSNSSSSGSKKVRVSRRRRLSIPDETELTPTPAIEVRPRAVSDPSSVGDKSNPFKEPFEDPNLSNVCVEVCKFVEGKPVDHTITEADFNEALGSFQHRPRANQIFSYAKTRYDNNNAQEPPRPNNLTNFKSDEDLNGLSGLGSKSSHSSVHSSYNSPGTSRSGSSHDIMQDWSRSSSTRDCSKLPTDTDHQVDVDPAFIFRQLYPLLPYNTEKSEKPYTENAPLCLPETEELSRTLKTLDLILVSNTHKIGVIYLGPGQNKEVNILRNTYGSERYMEFLQNLGDMIWLQNTDQSTVYIGGLDTKGADGDYTISWRDKTTQVVFHVATMMPQHDTDPTSTNKKRHIGNNFVTIVYNNSGAPYQQGTIKGQLNFCDMVIEPKTCGMNLVSFISTKKTALTDLKPHGGLLVSDKPLPNIVRQLAVNANSLCQVIQGTSGQSKNAYYCNWLERLKKIQKIQMKPITPVSSPIPSRKSTYHKGA